VQPTKLQSFRFPEDHAQPHKIALILNTANPATERLGAYYRCGYCGIFPKKKKVDKLSKIVDNLNYKNGRMNI